MFSKVEVHIYLCPEIYVTNVSSVSIEMAIVVSVPYLYPINIVIQLAGFQL